MMTEKDMRDMAEQIGRRSESFKKHFQDYPNFRIAFVGLIETFLFLRYSRRK